MISYHMSNIDHSHTFEMIPNKNNENLFLLESSLKKNYTAVNKSRATTDIQN